MSVIEELKRFREQLGELVRVCVYYDTLDQKPIGFITFLKRGEWDKVITISFLGGTQPDDGVSALGDPLTPEEEAAGEEVIRIVYKHVRKKGDRVEFDRSFEFCPIRLKSLECSDGYYLSACPLCDGRLFIESESPPAVRCERGHRILVGKMSVGVTLRLYGESEHIGEVTLPLDEESLASKIRETLVALSEGILLDKWESLDFDNWLTSTISSLLGEEKDDFFAVIWKGKILVFTPPKLRRKMIELAKSNRDLRILVV